MPLSAPEYWLEWAKNYFRCQFTYVGELIHKETWSAASFGWAEGLQMINPPIYRLTTAVSDIDQTNINRDIRDGNWLSMWEPPIWPSKMFGPFLQLGILVLKQSLCKISLSGQWRWLRDQNSLRKVKNLPQKRFFTVFFVQDMISNFLLRSCKNAKNSAFSAFSARWKLSNSILKDFIPCYLKADHW